MMSVIDDGSWMSVIFEEMESCWLKVVRGELLVDEREVVEGALNVHEVLD